MKQLMLTTAPAVADLPLTKRPRRTLVDHQAHLEATGDAGRIRIQWWDVYKTQRGDYRPVRVGETFRSLEQIEAMLAEGWRASRPDLWERFRAAVVAGKRYDIFDQIERAS